MSSSGTSLLPRRETLFIGTTSLVIALAAISAAPAHAQSQQDTTKKADSSAKAGTPQAAPQPPQAGQVRIKAQGNATPAKTDSTAKTKFQLQNGQVINIDEDETGQPIIRLPGGGIIQVYSGNNANRGKPAPPQPKTDSTATPKDSSAAKQQPGNSEKKPTTC